MKARIVAWLLRNEPMVTWLLVIVVALALMGQLDGVPL